ncbi:MAG: hypothetical protein ACREQ5_20545, partial [Candidatus Dormibacteria bacterium]
VYGEPSNAGPGQERNESLGPSPAWGGGGMLDPRVGYQPGQPITNPILMWSDNFFNVLNQVPSAISAVNISAAAVPVGSTPLVLVSASGAGITVGASVVNQLTGLVVPNLLAIDGAPANIAFGQQGPINVYDPRTTIARAVRITSVGNDSGATFTVRGFDIYGYPLSEIITGANAGIAAGKKAFKFILSVTPSAAGLSGSNVSVGTSDVYGFPLRVDEWQFADLYYGTPPAAFITSSTGFTAADVTNPATGITGDVRGTYAAQSASDGTKKLAIFISVTPWNLAYVQNATVPNWYAGLFGFPQFSN